MDSNLLGMLESALNDLIFQGGVVADNLHSVGVEIFGTLVGMKIIFSFLESKLGDSGLREVSGGVVRLIISVGIISYLLVGYNSALGIRGLSIAIPDYISTKVTGLSGLDSFNQGVVKFNLIMSSLDDAVVKTNGAASGKADGASSSGEQLWATVEASRATLVMLEVASINADIGMGSKALLGIAMLAYVWVYIVGIFTLYIVLAIGPVLLPFQLVRFTSFLANGWMKSLIVAMMMRALAPIALQLLGGSIDALKSATTTLNYSGQTAIGYSIAAATTVFMLSGLIVVLIWQVPKIALGLVSGGGGVSLGKSRRAIERIL
ncbi:type IV secretion system protein [Burkholderia gladioli]|uniref:type IV secretion system protein n=1 Tax=Burkholderia gladioli TaxID=28095 RepID=UPI002FE2E8C6